MKTAKIVDDKNEIFYYNRFCYQFRPSSISEKLDLQLLIQLSNQTKLIK